MESDVNRSQMIEIEDNWRPEGLCWSHGQRLSYQNYVIHYLDGYTLFGWHYSL